MKKIITLISACVLLASCTNNIEEQKKKVAKQLTDLYGDKLEADGDTPSVTVNSMTALTEKGMMDLSIAVLEQEIKGFDSLFNLSKNLAAQGVDTTALSFGATRPALYQNEWQADKQIADSLRKLYPNAPDRQVCCWKVEATLNIKGDGQPNIETAFFVVDKSDKIYSLAADNIRALCKGGKDY